ncbi:MAG: thioredoxin family protein [Campylobacterota bacterium]|nr:thioredoxin family protein [Campylobacterota bacterium]
MKITRYMLLIMMLFSLNLYGGSEKLVEKMSYETSYKKALKKAQELNKPIMMVVGQEGCPYCNKFESKTLTRKAIHAKVEKNFIPLTILKFKDEGSYPDKFRPHGVPTVLFIEPKEQKVFYKSFGYKSKREYKAELENALEVYITK